MTEDRAEAHDRLLVHKGIGGTTARIFLDQVPGGLYGSAPVG